MYVSVRSTSQHPSSNQKTKHPIANNHLWGFSNSAINMTQFQGGTNPYQQQQRAPSSFAQAAASSTNIASSVPAVNNMSIPAPDSSDFPALGSQQQQQSSFGRSPRILPPGLPMQQQQQQQPNHKLDNNPPVSVGAGLANVFPPLSNSTQVQPLEQQIQQSQTQPQDRGQTQQPLREGVCFYNPFTFMFNSYSPLLIGK